MNRRGGFTLTELIMVLVIIGTLAVAVIPRLLDRNIFDSRGFHDETLATLRYAQKIAIAQRRNVCVAFTATSITLTVAAAAGTSVACTKNLKGPDGAVTYTLTAPSGVRYSTAAPPSDFVFTALGRASVGRTFRVDGVALDITVESETGYVHS